MSDMGDAIKRAIDQARREGYAAGVRAAADLIDQGYDRAGINSKNDKCVHNFYGYEDCEQCASAAIRALYGKGPTNA